METITSNVFDTALVFEGGGYRGAFSSGIANVLLEQGIYFDYVCGVSAGSSLTVNYLSRDHMRMRESFLARISEKPIGGIRTMLAGKGYFDADYLYGGIVEDGSLPFDWETFSANPARFCIQAFERDAGRTVRFSRDDVDNLTRLLHVVRASSTMPGVMHPMPVDGRILLDGGLGEGGGIPVPMAEADGFERIFFVATRPKGYRKKPPTKLEQHLYIDMIAKDQPHLRRALLTRWKRYNAALDHVEDLAREGRAYIVYPDKMPVSNGTMNTRKLLAAYKMGHAQGEREVDLWRDFIFGESHATS